MADDPSTIKTIHLIGSMKNVMDLVADTVTEEDVKNDNVGKTLEALACELIVMARKNYNDYVFIDNSICIQEVIIAHRNISVNREYKNGRRKAVITTKVHFNSFNEYYDALESEVIRMFPKRCIKTEVMNKEHTLINERLAI